MTSLKCELFNDNFQNYKCFNIPKAQLILCDIPYNIGKDFYGSNPSWYVGGNRENGESKLAGKAAFHTDFSFNIAEFFHFVSRMLKPDPKKKIPGNEPPCILMFCSYEQQFEVIEKAKQYGFKHYIPLVFVKNYSPQALKANMRVVGATEYGLILYRDKLPKFRNERYTDAKGVEHGRMVFDWFEWTRDGKEIPRLHPTQKPIALLEKLISIFTDPGDVVIDPCAGSGSTLRAAHNLGRHAYGFEVDKQRFKAVMESDMLRFTENTDIKDSTNPAPKDGAPLRVKEESNVQSENELGGCEVPAGSL